MPDWVLPNKTFCAFGSPPLSGLAHLALIRHALEGAPAVLTEPPRRVGRREVVEDTRHVDSGTSGRRVRGGTVGLLQGYVHPVGGRNQARHIRAVGKDVEPVLAAHLVE